jgi:riboflavin biosynthesis pyrimidine reductase
VATAGGASDPDASGAATLTRLLPNGAAALAAELVAEMGLWERPAGPAPERPRTWLNMVSTVDGRATLHGRSGALSSPADRELFHALRTAVDAVLVGAGTVRSERYGRLIRDPARRALRLERGLSEEPLACVATSRLELDPAIPLLADPATHLVVLTPAAGVLPATACRVDYVRTMRDGRLDLAAALAELAERFGVRALLCEGGPHLGGEMIAAGLLDELLLSLAPKLAGGDPPGAAALRILAGAELDPAVELRLLGVLENESHLFLRYGVVAPERVSRATMPSSSDAS